MSMMMHGCQGHDKTPTLQIKKCPDCGAEVEIFSTDISVKCENCGFEIYNDAVSCVQWCSCAKTCVGEEQYYKLMEIAENRKKQVLELQNA